jgi:hypothetical protein
MTDDTTAATDEPDDEDAAVMGAVTGADPLPVPDASPQPRSSLGWLPASPAVVALVGGFLPWFAPSGTGHGGRLDIPTAFCWQAGRIGFLAPLALVVIAVAILGPRHGWFAKAQPPRTFGRDGLLLIGAGVFAATVVLLTWILLPASYTFSGLTWDNLTAIGFDLRRNPQPGYFLTIVAAADAVGCGIVYWLVGRRESRAEPAEPAGIIDNHDGEDSGR